MADRLIFKHGQFDDPQVLALLELHLKGMFETSPPGHSFALDLSGLKTDDVTFVSTWLGDKLAAIGALKWLSDTQAEIKSMRTQPDLAGQGIGAQLLKHLIDMASVRGIQRISLETGSGEPFEAAVRLYLRHGFKSGPAFADYTKSAFNQFYHLDL